MSHTRVAPASQTVDIRHLIIQLLDFRAGNNNSNASVSQFSEETVIFMFPSSHVRISITGFSIK